MQRDQEVNEILKGQEYTVFRFWEQELKRDFEGCFSMVWGHLKP
jgi:very-short-patch-repair endonuclease